MESNCDSCDLLWPKTEPGVDIDLTKPKSVQWNSENTMKLIATWEKDCKELWDTKHPLIRDKNARQARHEYLADIFDTTAEEISRKLHNLRTQFNNELRKIKKRQSMGAGEAGGSGWEYFDALLFLQKESSIDQLEGVESVNLALAEFQAEEEEEFAAVRAQMTSPLRKPKLKPTIRVAASAPPPLPASANPLLWPEEPLPRIRPGMNADECQIFGDFVASELRTLRSDESRKKLKRMIQKAILQIEEEEDVNIING